MFVVKAATAVIIVVAGRLDTDNLSSILPSEDCRSGLTELASETSVVKANEGSNPSSFSALGDRSPRAISFPTVTAGDTGPVCYYLRIGQRTLSPTRRASRGQ
jgi:hypothetical protein